MAEPTKKAPQIDDFLAKLTGRDRRFAVAADKCVLCDGPANKFRDAASEKEFKISGMCQKCQDKAFGESQTGDMRKLIREEMYFALVTMKKSKPVSEAVENDQAALARLKSEHVNYFGPEKGPFKCGHCRFFDSTKSHCNHPEVQANVEAEGCCNEYQPTKNA